MQLGLDQYLKCLRVCQAALLLLGIAASPDPIAFAQPNTGLIALEIGQAVAVCVDAKTLNNSSGVWLAAGAHYEFLVASQDTWRDLNIDCTAAGWTADRVGPLARPFVRASESKRRCPDANWFELVGSVGTDGCQHFCIGCRGPGWTYTPNRSGALITFANDLLSRYGNNSGSITLTIRRVAAPGKSLPSCLH